MRDELRDERARREARAEREKATQLMDAAIDAGDVKKMDELADALHIDSRALSLGVDMLKKHCSADFVVDNAVQFDEAIVTAAHQQAQSDRLHAAVSSR